MSDAPEGMKRCCKCKQVLPVKDFHRNGRRGPRSDCGACARAGKKARGLARRAAFDVGRLSLADEAACRKCRRVLPARSFHRQAHSPTGLQPYCRDCHYWVEIKRKYGITEEQYLSMLKSQGGGCGVCGGACAANDYLSVDHHHGNGRVRGLLCAACNKGLGHFKDDRRLLHFAANYLLNTEIKAANDDTEPGGAPDPSP